MPTSASSPALPRPGLDRPGGLDSRRGPGPVDPLEVDAPPFSRNPSAWNQRVPIVVLAGIATVLAGYLALYQWGLIERVWDPLFGRGSETVLDSGPSERMRRWVGIPDAALGAFAYLGDAVFGLAGSTRRWQYRPWLVLVFGFDVIPLGIVSIVLVILQGTVVGSWCFFCLVTAVISVILIALAYDEVWAALQYLRRVWRSTRRWRAVWDAFLGRYVVEGDRVALPGSGPEAESPEPESSRPIPGPADAGSSAQIAPDSPEALAGAWARVVEVTLGLWLAASVFVFASGPSRGSGPGPEAQAIVLGAAALVVLASLACFAARTRRAHLVTLVVGLGLAIWAFVQPRPVLAWQQNNLLVGLLLAMFAVIPTAAAAPPRGWRSPPADPERSPS